jgi:hypothetical protein
VVKDAKGKVVAASPIEPGERKIEHRLGKGEKAIEVEISEEDMRDPARFLRACTSATERGRRKTS